jgi:hypothetical protein
MSCRNSRSSASSLSRLDETADEVAIRDRKYTGGEPATHYRHSAAIPHRWHLAANECPAGPALIAETISASREFQGIWGTAQIAVTCTSMRRLRFIDQFDCQRANARRDEPRARLTTTEGAAPAARVARSALGFQVRIEEFSGSCALRARRSWRASSRSITSIASQIFPRSVPSVDGKE